MPGGGQGLGDMPGNLGIVFHQKDFHFRPGPALSTTIFPPAGRLCNPCRIGRLSLIFRIDGVTEPSNPHGITGSDNGANQPIHQ